MHTQAVENIFPYQLFGCYIIELGRFFKGTFRNLQGPGEKELHAQVFFGTPRAAYRFYMEEFNGMIKLPMINYHIAGMERKIEYEKIVWLPIHQSLNVQDGTMDIMRAPSVYEVTFAISLWNNDQRERDEMIHTLISSFPMGEGWLFHHPDRIKYPHVNLPMAFKLEDSIEDATELDNLNTKDTRAKIRTTLTMKCTRAFVPYKSFKTPVIQWVDFDSFMKNKLGNKTLTNHISASGGTIEENFIDLGLETAIIVKP